MAPDSMPMDALPVSLTMGNCGIEEVSTSFSENVDIGSSLTGAPHDGSGGGFITFGAEYAFTYYELGEQYACGRKDNVKYVTVNTNIKANAFLIIVII